MPDPAARAEALERACERAVAQVRDTPRSAGQVARFLLAEVRRDIAPGDTLRAFTAIESALDRVRAEAETPARPARARRAA
jgi:hypothetical protein